MIHFGAYRRDADTLSGLPSTDLPKLLSARSPQTTDLPKLLSANLLSARSPRPTLSPNYPLPKLLSASFPFRISSSIPFPSPSCRSPCGAWIEAISISYIYIKSFDGRKAEKYKKSARLRLTQKWLHDKIYIDGMHLDS